jgi:hypothetical protein
MQRRNFLASSLGLAAAIVAGSRSRAVASEGPDIMRIEEDWYILIGDPDPEVDAPQIVTIFGPQNPLTGIHSVFELNHGTQPDFSEGGMQLQCWDGNNLVGYRRQHAPAELHIANEVIRFTTATEIDNNSILMEVIDGTSESWGEFGGERALRQRVSVNLDNLNDFDPLDSIRNSRVTFGANRVQMFKRTELRYYSESGLHQTVTTDAIVEQWAS